MKSRTIAADRNINGNTTEDEVPGKEHRERLRQDQWRWREAEGVWTKQLDRERRATSQMEAERLFTEIGDWSSPRKVDSV